MSYFKDSAFLEYPNLHLKPVRVTDEQGMQKSTFLGEINDCEDLEKDIGPDKEKSWTYFLFDWS